MLARCVCQAPTPQAETQSSTDLPSSSLPSTLPHSHPTAKIYGQHSPTLNSRAASDSSPVAYRNRSRSARLVRSRQLSTKPAPPLQKITVQTGLPQAPRNHQSSPSGGCSGARRVPLMCAPLHHRIRGGTHLRLATVSSHQLRVGSEISGSIRPWILCLGTIQ